MVDLHALHAHFEDVHSLALKLIAHATLSLSAVVPPPPVSSFDSWPSSFASPSGSSPPPYSSDFAQEIQEEDIYLDSLQQQASHLSSMPSQSTTESYDGCAGATASTISSSPDTRLRATPGSPLFGAFGMNNTTSLFSNGLGVCGADGCLNSAAVQTQASYGSGNLNSLQSLQQSWQLPQKSNSFGSGKPLRFHETSLTSEYLPALGFSGASPRLVRTGSTIEGSMSGDAGAVEQEKIDISPSLLLAEGGGSDMNMRMTTPAQSRCGSRTSGAGGGQKRGKALISSSGPSVNISPSESFSSSSPNSVKSNLSLLSPTPTPPSIPVPPARLLLQKPFPCPILGCVKSYMQAIGLKYHLAHGKCIFTPSPEVLAMTEEGLSEHEMAMKLKPFCCQVPSCSKRYSNMNGLSGFLLINVIMVLGH